jgi:hypothetical protein
MGELRKHIFEKSQEIKIKERVDSGRNEWRKLEKQRRRPAENVGIFEGKKHVIQEKVGAT